MPFQTFFSHFHKNCRNNKMWYHLLLGIWTVTQWKIAFFAFTRVFIFLHILLPHSQLSSLAAMQTHWHNKVMKKRNFTKKNNRKTGNYSNEERPADCIWLSYCRKWLLFPMHEIPAMNKIIFVMKFGGSTIFT